MNNTITTQVKSPEIKWTPPRPVTRKEHELVKQLVDNPKITQAEAYKRAYNADNMSKGAIEQEASRTLKKPSVQLELAKYSATAESILVEVLNISSERMKDSKLNRAVDWAVNARQTADSLLDRVHGKAVTKVEQTSTSVELHIDLTGTAQDLDK